MSDQRDVEICRLQEEVRCVRADNERLMAMTDAKVLAYVRGIEADNDWLRAALQSLTTDPPATLDEPDTDAEVVIKMRELARRALEQKP